MEHATCLDQEENPMKVTKNPSRFSKGLIDSGSCGNQTQAAPRFSDFSPGAETASVAQDVYQFSGHLEVFFFAKEKLYIYIYRFPTESYFTRFNKESIL